MAYNIIIADDHAMFRQSVAELLSSRFSIDMIGEAKKGEEVLELIRETPNWHLIILDINMRGGMGGFETLKELSTIRNTPPVIVISFHLHYSQKSADLGAKGYLSKEFNIQDLHAAVRIVLEGGKFFPLLRKDKKPDKIKLTPHEIDILILICQENTSKEIADKLCLGENTVESYRKGLLRKTGSKNMAGLAIYAIEKGFFQV